MHLSQCRQRMAVHVMSTYTIKDSQTCAIKWNKIKTWRRSPSPVDSIYCIAERNVALQTCREVLFYHRGSHALTKNAGRETNGRNCRTWKCKTCKSKTCTPDIVIVVIAVYYGNFIHSVCISMTFVLWRLLVPHAQALGSNRTLLYPLFPGHAAKACSGCLQT